MSLLMAAGGGGEPPPGVGHQRMLLVGIGSIVLGFIVPFVFG